MRGEATNEVGGIVRGVGHRGVLKVQQKPGVPLSHLSSSLISKVGPKVSDE